MRKVLRGVLVVGLLAAVMLPRAASATQPVPDGPQDARRDDEARHWRFTGMLGVLAAPRPLALEAMARYRRADDPRWDLAAVGASVEYLPPGLVSFGDKTKLSWMQVAADGRWFPWRFLFVGLRAGYQFVRADSEKFNSEVDYVTSGLFVGPRIGALYTFGSGLTIGGDIGATIPIAPSTSLTSDGTQDSNARKVAKTFGLFVMPAASVKVGYTF